MKCKCGHEQRFHPLGKGGCFYTKSESNIIDIEDVDCLCVKFQSSVKGGCTND